MGMCRERGRELEKDISKREVEVEETEKYR